MDMSIKNWKIESNLWFSIQFSVGKIKLFFWSGWWLYNFFCLKTWCHLRFDNHFLLNWTFKNNSFSVTCLWVYSVQCLVSKPNYASSINHTFLICYYRIFVLYFCSIIVMNSNLTKIKCKERYIKRGRSNI